MFLIKDPQTGKMIDIDAQETRQEIYNQMMNNPQTNPYQEKKMYQVYFTNHSYYSSEKFSTAAAALSYAKGKGFNCRVDYIDRNGRACPVAIWSAISGTRWMSQI